MKMNYRTTIIVLLFVGLAGLIYWVSWMNRIEVLASDNTSAVIIVDHWTNTIYRAGKTGHYEMGGSFVPWDD